MEKSNEPTLSPNGETKKNIPEKKSEKSYENISLTTSTSLDVSPLLEAIENIINEKFEKLDERLEKIETKVNEGCEKRKEIIKQLEKIDKSTEKLEENLETKIGKKVDKMANIFKAFWENCIKKRDNVEMDFAKKLEEISTQIGDVKELEKELGETKERLEKEKNNVESEKTKAENELDRVKEELEKLKTYKQSLETEKTKCENELQETKETLDTLEKEKHSVESEKTEAKNELDRIKGELEKLNEDKQSLETEKTKFENELKATKERLEKEKQSIEFEKTEVKNELDRIKEELETEKRELESCQENLKVKDSYLEELGGLEGFKEIVNDERFNRLFNALLNNPALKEFREKFQILDNSPKSVCEFVKFLKDDRTFVNSVYDYIVDYKKTNQNLMEDSEIEFYNAVNNYFQTEVFYNIDKYVSEDKFNKSYHRGINNELRGELSDDKLVLVPPCRVDDLKMKVKLK